MGSGSDFDEFGHKNSVFCVLGLGFLDLKVVEVGL